MLSVTRYRIKDKRLKPWINFIWYLETKSDVLLHHKILPTNNIDIVLNLSEDINYQVNNENFKAGKFHINFMRNNYGYIYQNGKIKVWGISFYPFGLYPFIKIPLTDFKNCNIINLDDFSKAFTNKLEKELLLKTNKIDTVENIEQVLVSLLSDESEDAKVRHLISNFININKEISIKSFCSQYSLNEKTLERHFLKYIGYTPYKLKRIEKFQKSCNNLVFQKDYSNFSELAQNNEYYDQAHFIREFKNFSGTTPGKFLKERISIKENTKYIYL